MFRNERCSYPDLTLRCIELDSGKCLKEFRVNRSFLASASSVWFASLYGDFEESKPDAVIDLVGVAPHVLEHIIRHAYFLETSITVENALELRKLCERYQVLGLIPQCDQLIVNEASNPQRICAVLQKAVSGNLPSLIKKCVETIENKFDRNQTKEMLSSDTFQSLSIDVIKEMLKSDRLNIKEEALFEHIVNWAETQCNHWNLESLDEEEIKTTASEDYKNNNDNKY